MNGLAWQNSKQQRHARWRRLMIVPLLLGSACSQHDAGESEALPQSPLGQGESYYIARPALPHRQATAFAINRNAGWLSAQHSVQACDPLRMSDGLRLAKLSAIRQSSDSDAAVMLSGPRQIDGLAIAQAAPMPGEVGWAMGYANGKPRSVALRYHGPAKVLHADGGAGRREQATVWTQIEQAGAMPTHAIDFAGMSGGPVLNREGEVVGILSGQTSQRTRILVAPLRAIKLLINPQATAATPMPIADHADATRRLRLLVADGSLRLLYCERLASQREAR